MTEVLYHNIYFSIAFLMFLLGMTMHPRKTEIFRFSIFLGLLFSIGIAFFIGNRPMSVGTDTVNYWRQFNVASETSYSEIFSNIYLGLDPMISLFFVFASRLGDYNLALLLVSLCMNLFFWLFSVNVGKTFRINPLIILSMILASFTVWNEQVNTIRNGLAIPFFLNFIYYLYKKEYWRTLVFAVLALASHFSTILFIAVVLFINFTPFISGKWYILLYFGCLLASWAGLGITDFGIMEDMDFDKIEGYTHGVDEGEYIIGFRPTFALYNTGFLCVFLFYKYLGRINGKFIDVFLNLFLVASSIFFLWFVLPYSDRIGAYSWQLIPVLLTLIIYKENSKALMGFAGISYIVINYFI